MVMVPRARETGADLLVALLLVIAEEDVAMIDLAVDLDHVDGAQAAFAALAIVHHVVAAGIEHIKHRALARDFELDIGPFRRTRNVSVGSVPLEPKVS